MSTYSGHLSRLADSSSEDLRQRGMRHLAAAESVAEEISKRTTDDPRMVHYEAEVSYLASLAMACFAAADALDKRGEEHDGRDR